MAFSTLATISGDCLSRILDFCHGGDILRLLQCGNHTIGPKIRAVATKFDFFATPLSKFPFAAFSLLNLRELSIYGDYHGLAAALNLCKQSIVPSEPMQALQKLRYGFAQSGLIFDPPTSLRHTFPNLIELRLQGIMTPFTTSYFDAIPTTLRRLEIMLRQLDDDENYLLISYPLLRSLTCQLEELHLENFSVGTDDDDPSTAFNPSSPISKLHLSWILQPDLVLHLPASVEHVHLELDYRALPSSEKLTVSTLPRSLRSFTFQLSDDNPEMILDGPFPPLIEYWQCEIRVEKPTIDFPKSLTFIELPTSLYAPQLERIPPNLRQLSCYDPLEEMTELKSLPASLTKIFWRNPLLSHFSAFPSSLTSLRLHFTAPVQLKVPRTVWANFSLLTTLMVPLAMFESMAHFSCFPRLEWLYSSVSPSDSLPLDLIPHLPTTMKHISLMMQREGDWSQIFNNHLQRLSNLLFLYISTTNPVKVEEPTFLLQLPPNLEYLSMPMEKVWPARYFAHLPPHLKTLLISRDDRLSKDIEPLILTDDLFANLPKHLALLCVPPCSGLTSRLFQLLPPTIFEILITVAEYEGDFKADKKRYYDAIDWLGFPPPPGRLTY